MKIIYIDDEKPALENFYYTINKCKDIEALNLFTSPFEAIDFTKNNKVDMAFIDMEMNEMHGLNLAKEISKIDKNIHIVFVTAYNQYAFEAFNVNAIGYVLKPYSVEDIQKEINKALRIKPILSNKVVILTIPDFVLKVNGEVISFTRVKVEELFALLVDRNEAGLTTSEAISILWPNRGDDECSKALFRNTYKRLIDILKELKIDYIVKSDTRKKYINTNNVECDLYKILNGDLTPLENYNGEYMKKYSWAEERNALLYSLKSKIQ